MIAIGDVRSVILSPPTAQVLNDLVLFIKSGCPVISSSSSHHRMNALLQF